MLNFTFNYQVFFKFFSDFALAIWNQMKGLKSVGGREWGGVWGGGGVSLKNSLSCGWFCKRCHFSMSVPLWLGNAEWCSIAKRSIFFRAVFLTVPKWRFFIRESNLWMMYFYHSFQPGRAPSSCTSRARFFPFPSSSTPATQATFDLG